MFNKLISLFRKKERTVEDYIPHSPSIERLRDHYIESERDRNEFERDIDLTRDTRDILRKLDDLKLCKLNYLSGRDIVYMNVRLLDKASIIREAYSDGKYEHVAFELEETAKYLRRFNKRYKNVSMVNS